LKEITSVDCFLKKDERDNSNKRLEAEKEKNMLVNLNIVDKRRLRAYYTTQVDNE
jgi:hypothetical protein